MAREIQWDDRRVERDSSSADILSGSAATWTALSPRSWAVLHEGRRFKVECEKEPDEEGRATFRINGVRKEVRVLDERAQLLEKMGMSARTVVASGDIKAPMPGKVLQVLVNAGDTVEEGQALPLLYSPVYKQFPKNTKTAEFRRHEELQRRKKEQIAGNGETHRLGWVPKA